jgi:Tol biopolymer transport system component
MPLVLLLAVGCSRSSTRELEVSGRIAFTRGDHVWLMHADGSAQRRLTRGRHPTWSPDGSKIAFITARRQGSSTQIWVIGADGRDLRRLTKLVQPYDKHSSPVWSPDGKTIAFEGYNDGNYWINVVGVDGRGQSELSRKGGPYVDVAPVWSRDGRSIMFTSVLNDAVYVMRSNGSGRRELARINTARGMAWSPNRQHFTVVIDADLWLMTAEGRRLVKLFDSSLDKPETWSDVAWAPDGQTIAFSVLENTGEDAESDIYAVSADGSGLRKLTDNDRGHDAGPIWSRDGRAIAFVSTRDGNAEIYVMNAEGSNQRNVSDRPGPDWEPDWQPSIED